MLGDVKEMRKIRIKILSLLKIVIKIILNVCHRYVLLWFFCNGISRMKNLFFFIDNRLSKSLITQNFNAATRRVLSLDTYKMDNVTCLLCCWTTNLLE